MKKISILLTSLFCGLSFAQLQTYEVASQSQVSVVDTAPSANAACEYGVPYEDLTGEGVFIGDFTPIIVANDFIVSANSTFELGQIELYPVTGSGGSVQSAEIFIYKNTVDEEGQSHPGELVAQGDATVIDQFVLQEISFTGGETATEHFASFDLSSFDVIEGGASDETYWIGYRIVSTPTPLRYFGIIAADQPSTNFSTNDGETFRGLATSTDPRLRDLPYRVSGECSTLGTVEISNISLAVYPNPAKDVVNVSLKNAEVKSISVTNLSGQVVATSKISNVNVAALPAGVYVVKVLDSKGATHTSKIVKK